MLRFYDIDAGRIMVDGRSSRDDTRESLRRAFGMVLQDTWPVSYTHLDVYKRQASSGSLFPSPGLTLSLLGLSTSTTLYPRSTSLLVSPAPYLSLIHIFQVGRPGGVRAARHRAHAHGACLWLGRTVLLLG